MCYHRCYCPFIHRANIKQVGFTCIPGTESIPRNSVRHSSTSVSLQRIAQDESREWLGVLLHRRASRELTACHPFRDYHVNKPCNPPLKERVMYRKIKSSNVLASVMAIILLLPGSAALADDGRYDNDGHQGSHGWNGHYEGYHGNHAPNHRYYNRGYHPGYYPSHYQHYYPPQPSCGTCSQKNQHNHNNHNHHWWHFW